MTTVKQIAKFILIAGIACPGTVLFWFLCAFTIKQWFYGCSYDPDGHSPCLIAHVILDKDSNN